MVYNTSKQGFTLIELLIVIAIMGLLASIVMVSFPAAMKSVRDNTRKRDLAAIRTALEQYWDVHDHYPTEALCYDLSIGTGPSCTFPSPPQSYWDSNSDLQDLVADGYFGKIPIDPINNATYYYDYEPDNVGQAGCLVNTCQWSLCAKLEQAGAWYCVYSVRRASDFPRGGP